MSTLNILVPPTPSKISMVTMTVGYTFNTFINLKVLYSLELDDDIVGIKCDNKIRGKIKLKPNKKQNKKTKDFKNQCTFIINVHWGDNNVKLINAKLFNNGKLIFTGCTDIEQIEYALNCITQKLWKRTTICFFGITDEVIAESKKIHNTLYSEAIKKEIIFNKWYIKLILEFWSIYSLYNNIEEFCDNIVLLSYYTNYDIYIRVYKYMAILKSYYPIVFIKEIYELPEFIISVLTDKIDIMFPSYIGNEVIIPIKKENIKILNINSRMSCGFSIKKNVLYDLLKADPHIKSIYYDENIYPGIKAQYLSDSIVTKKLEIIFFNSGKINITSTQTFAQIDEIYEFITSFCKKNYEQICIQRDDLTLLNKHIESLPNQYVINHIDGNVYILVKKLHILANKRNEYILKTYI